MIFLSMNKRRPKSILRHHCSLGEHIWQKRCRWGLPAAGEARLCWLNKRPTQKGRSEHITITQQNTGGRPKRTALTLTRRQNSNIKYLLVRTDRHVHGRAAVANPRQTPKPKMQPNRMERSNSLVLQLRSTSHGSKPLMLPSIAMGHQFLAPKMPLSW